MDFQIHATGDGKRIKVTDRIGGGDVFNAFVGADQFATVTVASNDGSTGDIDLAAQMRADSPWVSLQSDYAVQANAVIEVPDV